MRFGNRAWPRFAVDWWELLVATRTTRVMLQALRRVIHASWFSAGCIRRKSEPDAEACGGVTSRRTRANSLGSTIFDPPELARYAGPPNGTHAQPSARLHAPTAERRAARRD